MSEEKKNNTIGIIAEYNPFHYGHEFLIRKAKELSGAEHVIVVMSGDFVQRGEPAVFSKFLRAKMAVSCGADAAIILPVMYSTGSAEYFARAGISILDKLGVPAVCFGSECGEMQPLYDIARALSVEPAKYQTILQSFLREGESFPSARVRALEVCADEMGLKIQDPTEVMSKPNNILAIEYLKAIIRSGSTMDAYTIRRMGKGYHETELSGQAFSSATGLRREVKENGDIGNYIPPVCMQIFGDHPVYSKPLFLNDFSDLLEMAIHRSRDLTAYVDVNEEIANTIRNNSGVFHTFEDWVAILTSKTYPAGRARRCLIHILLDLTKEDLTYWSLHGDTPYAKVLAVNPEAANILATNEEDEDFRIITRNADEKKLSPEAAALRELDHRAYDLWRLVYQRKYNITLPTDLEQPVLTPTVHQ